MTENSVQKNGNPAEERNADRPASTRRGGGRVFCFGALVADIIASGVGPEKDWHEKQRIPSIGIHLGGDAANQAVRLADLGVPVALVSCTGRDLNGMMLLTALKNRGVDTAYITEKDAYGTGTAVVLVSPEGERHIFSSGGAHSTISRKDFPSLPEDCAAVSLGSLFLMPDFEEAPDGLLEILKEAQARHIPVIADMASDKQHKGPGGVTPFLPYIDWFLPSAKDAMDLTKTASPEDAALAFRAAGAKNVVIKCGGDGALYLPEDTDPLPNPEDPEPRQNREDPEPLRSPETPDTFIRSQEAQDPFIRIPALPVAPADTTGAGDTFVGLFVSRIIKGVRPEDAIRFACTGASLSTLHQGASAVPVTEEEILEAMKQRY